MPLLRRMRPVRLSPSTLLLVSLNALVLAAIVLLTSDHSPFCASTHTSFKFWIDNGPQRQPQAPPAPSPPPRQEIAPMPAVPDSCDCGPTDHMCAKYGEHNLARSRAFEGANGRFRRVLRAAKAGKPTKIAVLGGSVTKGQGIRAPENWVNVFALWWNATFPNSATTLANGAVPATGSDYMSVCFLEHMDEDADLVLTEFAINDQRKESNAETFEWFLRSVLQLPKSPAVLNLQTFGLGYAQLTTGGDLHTAVANYYDTPLISLRNVLLPHILRDPAHDDYYFGRINKDTPDYKHLSKHGHEMLAELLIAYTERQLCAIAAEDVRHLTAATPQLDLPLWHDMEDVPRLRLMEKYNKTHTNPRMQPFCASTRTTKHPLVPRDATGWALWAHEKFKHKPYVRATEPGSRVAFDVRVGPRGRVRLTFLRSMTFGLGSVKCWIDDQKQYAVRFDGHWEIPVLNIARTEVVGERIPEGDHVLWCELLRETRHPDGGTEFRIVAVDAV